MWLQNILNDSSTYQAILREGAAAARQEDLLTLLQERFGTVPPDVESRIRSTTDLNRLQAALRQVLHISAPDEIQL